MVGRRQPPRRHAPAALWRACRVATSAAFRGKRSTWMFDCGEDTQRNLLKSRVIAWNRVSEAGGVGGDSGRRALGPGWGGAG